MAKGQPDKKRQSGRNEQRAHEPGFRCGLEVIVVRVIDPHVARKALIAGISGLKISDAHTQEKEDRQRNVER